MVTRSSRLARLVLFAYPRSFRRTYGTEFVRSIADLRTHGDRDRAGVAGLVVVDVVRTAPRMRLESVMSNHKAIAVVTLLAVGVFAALVGSPLLLLLVVASVVLAAILLRRGDRPIVASSTSLHWYRWMAAGAACFLVGGVILAVDGPELSSAGWTVWMLSWTVGLALVLFGAVLLLSRLLHRSA